MRQFFKRLFCWHWNWDGVGPTTIFIDSPRLYRCRECGKEREYAFGNMPINLSVEEHYHRNRLN